MIVRVARRESGYTVADNGFIDDPRLSLEAKGVMLMALRGRDEDLDFETLLKRTSTGRSALRSALACLEEHGYVRRSREHGRWTMTVYERPDLAAGAPDASAGTETAGDVSAPAETAGAVLADAKIARAKIARAKIARAKIAPAINKEVSTKRGTSYLSRGDAAASAEEGEKRVEDQGIGKSLTFSAPGKVSPVTTGGLFDEGDRKERSIRGGGAKRSPQGRPPEPGSDHALVRDHWLAAWSRAHGGAATPYQYGRDDAAIRDLLKACAGDRALAVEVIDAYLSLPDDDFIVGKPLTLLRYRLEKCVALARGRQGQRPQIGFATRVCD